MADGLDGFWCDSEDGVLKRVAVASPRFFRTTDPINARQEMEYRGAPIDVARLCEEHRKVVAALGEQGVEVVEIPPHPDLPYLLNVRDVGVVHRDRLIMNRMGKPIRQPEPYWVGGFLAGRFMTEVSSLGGGRLEGGDVFHIGGAVAVGLGPRTDQSGVRELRSLVGDRELVCVRLRQGVLHLDTAFNLVGRVAVVASDLLLDPEGFITWLKQRSVVEHVVELSEEQASSLGSNWLAISPTTVLTNAEPADLNGRLRSLGVRTVVVGMTEHHRIGGSVRCMTLPLLRERTMA